jgi:hypothetical protein
VVCRARTSSSILQWATIKEYGMEVGIYDEKDVSPHILCTIYFHPLSPLPISRLPSPSPPPHTLPLSPENLPCVIELAYYIILILLIIIQEFITHTFLDTKSFQGASCIHMSRFTYIRSLRKLLPFYDAASLPR